MSGKWRRRNYFIKKDLQGKYMFSFFVLVFLGIILFTAIFSLLSANSLTIIYKDYNLKIGKTPVVLIMEILRAHWIFLLTGGLFVAVLAMFITHRFAGPLYRLEQSVREMNNGNIGLVITLRKNDEGKDLAAMINEFNEVLSSRLKEMKEISEEIDDVLRRTGSAGNDREENERLLLRTRDLNGKIRELLRSYRLRNE